MNSTFKRVVSFILTLVIVIGFLPSNVLSAATTVDPDAPTSISISAYPARVAVGQISKLTIKDQNGNVLDNTKFTYASSDKDVAFVDGSGNVTGAHSGTATITATYTGTSVSASIDIVVTAVSKYNITSTSFNIGNDTDGDGIVDDFGGDRVTCGDTTTITVPNWGRNNSTLDKNHYIPFYATGSYKTTYSGTYKGMAITTNGGAWYSGRASENYSLHLYAMYNSSSYANNAPYFTSYDYMNLDKTAPWQWYAPYYTYHSGYGVRPASTYLTQYGAQITTTQLDFADDRKLYVTIKLEVPATGEYKIDVDTGKTGGVNEVFYLVPTSAVSSNNASILCADEYKLFNIDIGAGTTTNTTTRELQKGEYYFVLHFDEYTVASTKTSTAYLESITLTLKEWDNPALKIDNDRLLIGGTANLNVSQSNSFGEDVAITNVNYSIDDESILALELSNDGSGTAKIKGLNPGRTKVRATYEITGQGEVTDVIDVVVSGTLEYNIVTGAFNIGNDTNFDGIVDVYDAGISTKNNWYNVNDNNADHYIPFDIGKSLVNADNCLARSDVGWMLYAVRSAKYLKPDYQNPDKTAPWTWYTYGNLTTGTYFNVSSSYIEYNKIEEGNEPYFVVKLDVSKQGTFNVKVNAGSKRVHNQHYYLIPGSVVDAAATKDRTLWFNQDYYLGNIDTSSDGPYNQTFTSYNKDKATNTNGVNLTEDTYYFVTKIDNDGTSDSTTGTFAFFKSVSLILNEMTGIYIENDEIKVEAGKSVIIEALEQWTTGETKQPTGEIGFSSADPTIADVHPTNGTVVGKSKGNTVITVIMGEVTATVNVTVMTDEIMSVNVSSNATELPTGDATRVNIKEIWTVSGEKAGNLSDYTFKSSDESIAFVDAHGNVLGVGVGEVTITATMAENPAISGAVVIKVVAAQTSSAKWLFSYNFTTNAFNVGNDTDGDGIVDDFGGKTVTCNDGTTTVKVPQFSENPLTKDKNLYIPYYVTGTNANKSQDVGEFQSNYGGAVSLNGGLRYRDRTGQTFLHPIYSNALYANNSRFFTTYDYLNSDKTAPWQWSAFNAGIDAANTYLTQSVTWIYFSKITDGSEPYVVLKLNIPESGEYDVSFDAGKSKCGINMHFYLLPVSAVAEDNRETVLNDENKVGNLDLSLGVNTVTFDKKLQIPAPGEYYFVVKIDNDVESNTYSAGNFAYIKSLTLVKDKMTGLSFDPAEIALQKNDSKEIKVEEVWSISGNKPTSMPVTFTSEDPSIATVDANGVVTAVTEGNTNIIVSMGPVSGKVPVLVTKDLLTEISIGNTAVEFTAGSFFSLQLNEKWTISGIKTGKATDYTFTSSNQKVASVDVNGIVTGVTRGKVTITATHKVDATIIDKIDLYVLSAQPTGDAVEITYNFVTNSYNIGNDSNGDGVVDDFGDNANVANGLILKSMYNTWTDKTADYFIPYYATDANDKNPTIPEATNNNGYAHSRAREYAWRLYPIWNNAKYPKNEPYFNQYRYQNGANTGYWQWTKFNSYIDADQTYLLNKHTMIRSSNKDIVDGKEPYVTLKLMVPVAGTYHFSMTTKSGGMAKLHMYMVPVEEYAEPTREDLLQDKYKVGTIDNRITTTVKNDNAFTAEKAGEYYLVIMMDNDNWEKGESGYPTSAPEWDIRLVSATLTLDKQIGLSATTDREILRPGGVANISVYDSWKYDGNKFIKDLSTVTFTSDNESIAKVNANGVITGVGEGIANITVSKGGFSTTVSVTVKGSAKMTSIKLTNPQKWVNILRTAQLVVEEIWSFSGAETVTDIPGLIEFTSSDPKIATIDKYGKITGISTGKVTITAKHKVSGLTTTLEVEVSGVLEYIFKTTSYNVGNFDEVTNKYDFGDEATTTDQIRNWIESTWNDSDPDYRMNYNSWTDKTAEKFVPFYVTNYDGTLSSNTDASWKSGYIWGRSRNGMWQFNPFFTKYPKNEYFVNSYEYQNSNRTAPWKWTEFHGNMNLDNTYISNSFTWLEFNSFKDGTEPYVAIKIQVPIAGLYTVDVNFSATNDANMYFYIIPANKVSEITRDTLIDAYCIGAPLNLSVFSSKTYNGSFNAEEAGEYYFVIKVDDDHLEEGKTLSNRFARLSSLVLTPDAYTGIQLTVPTKEIEVGWHVNAGVNTTWKAGGKDDIIDLAKEVKFVSSDPSVATVDANGKIIGLKAGKTTITATELSTDTTSSVIIVVKAKGQGKQDTHIYFTKVDPDKKLADVTIEDEGWEFNYDLSHSSTHTSSNIRGSYGLETTNRSKYCNSAIDVYVRHDGYYQIKMTSIHLQNNTKRADIYVDGTYIGDFYFNGLNEAVADSGDLRTIYLTTGVHTFNFIPREDSGQSPPANYNYMVVRELRLKLVDEAPAIKKTEVKEVFMSVGAVEVPEIQITTQDNFVYSTTVPQEYPLNPASQKLPYVDTIYKIDYQVISGADVIQVNSYGQITSLKEGLAQVRATITYFGKDGAVIGTREVDIPVTVSTTGEDPKAKQLAKIEIVGSWYEKLGAYNQAVFAISQNRSYTYYVKGINALGEEIILTDANYAWTIGNTNIVTTDADSESSLTLTAKNIGKTTVKVTVTLGDNTASTSFEVESKKGKTGRTVYTDEMIETARYNITQYEWATTTRDNAVARAQRFIGFKDFSYDTIWDSVTSQGVPRAMIVGTTGDPNNYVCRYCDSDLYRDYGIYCYPTDPFNTRWKLYCPECNHKFPTNDFGSFYELGRTAENNGKFDRITALENHREMLLQKGLLGEEASFLTSPGVDGSAQWKLYYGYGVKGGYLYNETCPGAGKAADFKGDFSEWETTEGWGVDDGMGYYTGRKLSNGKAEFYPFVAYYNHIGLWFSPKDYLIVGTITACANAYMYTGDVEYGRIAAILLDRVADVYPEMNTSVYKDLLNNDGNVGRGHVIGRIWNCLMAEQLPVAYDIVYPLYDDPVVIDFLNDKGHEWGYGDGKDSAAKIRENIEMNMLVETFDAAKNGLIYGNFGLHQAVVAGTAAVLDTYPYTQEMINWLYQKNARENDRNAVTGGDISHRLVDIVWRDGQNHESPYYNEMGISDFSDAAFYLQVYTEYDGLSIYENPKYISLMNSFQSMTLVRRGVHTSGDAGSIFSYIKYPSVAPMKEAFYFLKDDASMRDAVIKIAQHLYFMSGGLLDGQHYDIFTENPESYAEDILAFIQEYGEYDYDKSSILTGYGFAYLRDGTLYDVGTRDGQLQDTTRDFVLNFSGHWGHNHEDILDLQLNAFGIPMTGDFGYPESFTGTSGYSDQFLYTPFGHNTVVVDEMGQRRTMDTGKPLHFDANDFRVKVMDAEDLYAYSVTDEYRRTIVMIDFNDDISYGIDFFRVAGGDDHLYSFMPASEEHPVVSDNLAKYLVNQKTGSYAGPDVPFGDDPNTGKKRLEFPKGYTWVFDIDKAVDSGLKEFWMDYQITDFRNMSRNDKYDGSEILDARLRITMLNDFAADEIVLGSVMPQSQKQNDNIDHLEKLIVRRKGYDLDSLFTTVYEPYEEGKKYISTIDSAVLEVTVAEGKPAKNDVVKAVRVKIDDGNGTVRYDYVVYASNNNIMYTITDPERNITFNCRGFVGVYSTDAEGNNIYTYINDGDYIGNPADTLSTYEFREITGKVTDFQRELSASNWIDVSFSKPISEELVKSLADRMLDVERVEAGNSCFFIEGVSYELNEDGTVSAARLDIGTVTTIAGYVDPSDVSLGFEYDVFKNASFTIKMSYEGGADADYSVLDAEIEHFNSLNSSDYSVDSWLRYQIAIEKGLALSRKLKSIDQKLIDDVVAEIQTRKAELVAKTKSEKPKKADYAALDEEIAMMDVMDPALYTIESWEAYVAVWQEAVELDRNLTDKDQQIIDDMVAKLKAAREALQPHAAAGYTLVVILSAAFAVVLITTVVLIVVFKRRRKLEALENAAEEVPVQE